MTPRNAYKKAFLEDKRLPELEYIILADPWYSFLYAAHVIEGQWKEAEDVIMDDPQASFYYSKDVIEGKLPDKMHNRMLLYAIEKSSYLDPELILISTGKWVKLYFEFINK